MYNRNFGSEYRMWYIFLCSPVRLVLFWGHTEADIEATAVAARQQTHLRWIENYENKLQHITANCVHTKRQQYTKRRSTYGKAAKYDIFRAKQTKYFLSLWLFFDNLFFAKTAMKIYGGTENKQKVLVVLRKSRRRQTSHFILCSFAFILLFHFIFQKTPLDSVSSFSLFSFLKSDKIGRKSFYITAS